MKKERFRAFFRAKYPTQSTKDENCDELGTDPRFFNFFNF